MSNKDWKQDAWSKGRERLAKEMPLRCDRRDIFMAGIEAAEKHLRPMLESEALLNTSLHRNNKSLESQLEAECNDTFIQEGKIKELEEKLAGQLEIRKNLEVRIKERADEMSLVQKKLAIAVEGLKSSCKCERLSVDDCPAHVALAKIGEVKS